jgi:carbamoyltransferase
MSNILGISAYFHDSSACLIQDGQIIAAVLEERFSRIKHDSSFPEKSIRYCLEEGEISSHDIDEVIFFEKPITKFERILDNLTKQAPYGFKYFQKAVHAWMSEKF